MDKGLVTVISARVPRPVAGRGGDGLSCLGIGRLVQRPTAAGAIGHPLPTEFKAILRSRSMHARNGGLCHLVQPPGSPARS